jgi:hypothetical protein
LDEPVRGADQRIDRDEGPLIVLLGFPEERQLAHKSHCVSAAVMYTLYT